MLMKTISLRTLDTNYTYLLVHENKAWVIDPGEAEPVQSWLKENDIDVVGFLLTHYHPDHVGGVMAMRTPDHVVLGADPFDFPYEKLEHDQMYALFDDVSLRAISLPGHTLGAMGYLIGDQFFTGDVLFGGGAGRIFEGTVKQMLMSLNRIKALDPNTKLYFGHEYTQANLGFAQHVMPDNEAVVKRMGEQAGVPQLLSVELATNPFLRLDDPKLQAAIKGYAQADALDEAAMLGVLRTWKNKYDAGER